MPTLEIVSVVQIKSCCTTVEALIYVVVPVASGITVLSLILAVLPEKRLLPNIKNNEISINTIAETITIF